VGNGFGQKLSDYLGDVRLQGREEGQRKD